MRLTDFGPIPMPWEALAAWPLVLLRAWVTAGWLAILGPAIAIQAGSRALKAHGGLAERNHAAHCLCREQCTHCYCMKPVATLPVECCCWCARERLVGDWAT